MWEVHETMCLQNKTTPSFSFHLSILWELWKFLNPLWAYVHCGLWWIDSHGPLSCLSRAVQLTNKFNEGEECDARKIPSMLKSFFPSVCLVLSVGRNQQHARESEKKKRESVQSRSEVMIGCWPTMSCRQCAEHLQHLCHIPFHCALLLTDPDLQQL